VSEEGSATVQARQSKTRRKHQTLESKAKGDQAMKKLTAWNEAIKATTIRPTDSPQRKANLAKIRQEIAADYERWGEGAAPRPKPTKPAMTKAQARKLDQEIADMIRKNGGKK
jgi:hypothetical protein